MKIFDSMLVAFVLTISISALSFLIYPQPVHADTPISSKQPYIERLGMEAEGYRQIFIDAQKRQNRWPIWKKVMPFRYQPCLIPGVESFFSLLGIICYDFRNHHARSSKHWLKVEMLNKDLSNMDLSVQGGSDQFLSHIIFNQTKFTNSNLTNNTIDGGHVEQSNLDNVIFTYGRIGNMTSSSFTHSDFRHGSIGGPLTAVEIKSSDFSDTNFAYSQFFRSKFTNVIFDRANLEGVIFDNVEFDNVSFDAASINNAILINQKGLSKSVLLDMKAKGAIVDKWSLAKRLKSVDLSIIDHTQYNALKIFYQRFLSKTDLSEIDMSSANLHSFFIYRCNISNSSFENANLKWTSFFELERNTHNVNFKNANLTKASFIRNSYKKINFQQTDLTDSYFNTNMQDVSFLGANLTGVKLGNKAKLKNIKYNSRSFEIDDEIVPPTRYEVDFFNQNKIIDAVDLSQ